MPKTKTSVQYRWSIVDLERRLSDGYVLKAFWKLEGVQDSFAVYKNGSLCFADGSPALPYESITEEVAIDWVIAAIGINEINELQKAIATELNQLANPVFSFGLPWISQPEQQDLPGVTVLTFVEGQSAH